MSSGDYISKSTLLDFLEEELKQDRPDGFKIYNTKRYIEDIPTLDEKEIIRKTVDRIVERLEEAKFPQKIGGEVEMVVLKKRIDEIVKEEGGIDG